MLRLKKEVFEQISRHCLREFPNEACGILAGKDSFAYVAFEMNNADKSPDSFLMEPKEQLRIMKEIRNSANEMVAIYHSHVASEAYPSVKDVKLAFYPEVYYAILTLKDKDDPELRAFRIRQGLISEEQVAIE